MDLSEQHKNANYEYAFACNFIVGCSGDGCEVKDICWARRMFRRQSVGYKPFWGDNEGSFDIPQFYPEVLKKLNRKSRLHWETECEDDPVFYLNGMGDPFDKHSPLFKNCDCECPPSKSAWSRITETLNANPQSHLILLTKQPQNIPEGLPKLPNLWLGVSVDGTANTQLRIDWLAKMVDYPNKMVSIEPIQGLEIDLIGKGIRWVVIGGYSGKKCAINRYALRRWIDKLYSQFENPSYFMKSNLGDWEENLIREWPEVKNVIDSKGKANVH